MQIVANADNMHKMSKHVLLEKEKNIYFNVSSAEFFTQSAKR